MSCVKRRRRLLCPPVREGLKVVYLIGTKDGRLKIGLTKHPRFRTETHHRQLGVAWVHFFPSCSFGHLIEYQSKRELEKIGQRFKKTELYSGIEKADAIRVVREVAAEHFNWLRESAAQAAEREAERAAWRAFRAQYVSDRTNECTA